MTAARRDVKGACLRSPQFGASGRAAVASRAAHLGRPSRRHFSTAGSPKHGASPLWHPACPSRRHFPPYHALCLLAGATRVHGWAAAATPCKSRMSPQSRASLRVHEMRIPRRRRHSGRQSRPAPCRAVRSRFGCLSAPRRANASPTSRTAPTRSARKPLVGAAAHRSAQQKCPRKQPSYSRGR